MSACKCGCGANANATYVKGHNRSRPAWDRFWEKVIVGDCWEWSGATHEAGYGRFNSGGRIVPSHRWAYEALVGAIPPGMHLDHLCRNTGCVNPDHLEPVTSRENTMRGYGPATRGIRGVVSANPDAPSNSPEYKAAKNREYMADPARRERKSRLQRERRQFARLLEGGVDA